MMRWIGSLVLSGAASMVMAQAPFTIVRPADGSRVREKVHILIPKGSIPPNGYVGIFLDGKLLEATRPPVKGKYFDYVLDTKGRGLADTPKGQTQKLEVVLYTDYEEKSRIVDRSSVNIKIGNHANINVPNSGIKLRYTFTPGQEMVYNLTQHVSVSQISEEQNSLGGKAAQEDTELEKIRLSYTVVNSYPNGEGLLRLQPLPTKGKDYADLTATGSDSQKRYYDVDMAPIYMRITSTGQEVFGAIPARVAFESVTGDNDPTHLYVVAALPTLPYKAVRPGDSWQSRFQDGKVDLANYVEAKSVTSHTPARGEFVGVEWEMGHPCAKLRNTIEAADNNAETKALTAKGAKIAGDKISLEETIWFALDTHKILKIQEDKTIDRKVENEVGGMGGPGMMPGMGGPGSAPGMAPGMGRGGASKSDVTGPAVPDMQRGGRRGGGGMQGGGRMGGGFGPGMAPGMGGPGMMPGMGGPGRTGAPATSAVYVRIHTVATYTLEQ